MVMRNSLLITPEVNTVCEFGRGPSSRFQTAAWRGRRSPAWPAGEHTSLESIFESLRRLLAYTGFVFYINKFYAFTLQANWSRLVSETPKIKVNKPNRSMRTMSAGGGCTVRDLNF